MDCKYVNMIEESIEMFFAREEKKIPYGKCHRKRRRIEISYGKCHRNRIEMKYIIYTKVEQYIEIECVLCRGRISCGKYHL